MEPIVMALVASVVFVAIMARILLATSGPPKGLLSLSSLPKPKEGNWLLGQLLSVLTPRMHDQMLYWANELGPLYTFRIANKKVLAVSDLAIFQQITGSGEDALPKAAFAYEPALDLGLGVDGIFTFTDFHNAEWRTVRKGLAPAFSMENVRKILPVASAEARDMVAKWSRVAAVETEGKGGSAVSNAGTVFVGDDLPFMTLNIFLKGAMNLHLSLAETNHFLEHLDACLNELTLRITNPLRQPVFNYLPFLPWSRNLKGHFQVIRNMWMYCHKHIRSNAPYEDTDTGICACFWRLEKDHSLTDLQIGGNISAIVVGGFETNAGTIAWALYDIASHPSVQKTLSEELRAAGLLHDEGGKARDVKWEDLWVLPYFSAVLKESMRLHTVAASSSAIREADRDVAIAGYHVPKGTVVWASLTSLHTSVHNYEDPLAFKPERWLQPSGSTAAAAFIPFSNGPRNCIGQNLANVVVRSVLLELVSALWFDVPSCMGSLEEVHKRQVVGLTLKLDGGMRLQARPHRH